MTIPQISGGALPDLIPLWPNAAPLSLGSEPVDVPTLKSFPPSETATRKASGACVLVLPGGGYGNLAAHEGDPVAMWLASLGVHAFVLKYRLGPRYRHPAPLFDAQRAVRIVRSRADEFGIDPKRIGMLGFSAGGHLTALASTMFDAGNSKHDDPIERVSSRPDRAVLLYPVILMTQHTHGGSRKNLLGENPSQMQLRELSMDSQVTSLTPPTFLFHTVDDPSVPVENSLAYGVALRRCAVPFEMHLFEHGRHGVGMATDDAVLGIWPKLLEFWLGRQGFLVEA